MTAFTYPSEPDVRRHGPQGYADAASYRPWLRDEFAFRCVYCLFREQWGKLAACSALSISDRSLRIPGRHYPTTIRFMGAPPATSARANNWSRTH